MRFLKCVTEIRRCQIFAPDKYMDPIDTCVSARATSLCLSQGPVRYNCTNDYDKVFRTDIIKIYRTILLEENCMKSIECARRGIQCWKKTLEDVDTIHMYGKFPLSLYYLMDIHPLRRFFSKVFSVELLSNNDFHQLVCS